jgi:ABC-type amino acid transport substrate-binding protein
MIKYAFLALLIFSVPAFAAEDESAYERVMRTGTLRCGYIVWQPYLLKDPNTGKMSGAAYDFTMAMAGELGLKVEWAEETGWGNFQEGLNAGRYDMMCVPVWESGQRARAALLSRPVYYNHLIAAARGDDDRFTDSFTALDKPDIRIAVVDGDVTQNVRQLNFPHATEVALPQGSDSTQPLAAVTTKKADIILTNAENIRRFNKNSDVKIRIVAKGVPVRQFANSYAFAHGEFNLKHMVDSTLHAMNISGQSDSILKKYNAGLTLQKE